MDRYRVEGKFRALNALVVDDDEAQVLATRRLFAELGIGEVEWAATYDAGLAAIRTRKHDICFVNYRLPGESGLHLLKQALEEGCTAPIIMLTGKGDEEVERQALAAGAADYLIKGAITDELLKRSIRHALERARTIAALRESERQFRSIFDHALDAMLILDGRGRMVDANAAACALFGVTREEFVSRGGQGGTDQEAPADSVWQRLLREGRMRGEAEVFRADGEKRVLEYTATANILPGRHLSILRDVTERHLAEQTRVRLATLVQSTDDAIIALTSDGVVTDLNPGAERLLGCAAEELIGKPLAGLIPAQDVDEVSALLGRARRGEVIRSYETVRRTHGRDVVLSFTISPIHDASGNLVGVSAIARDITEPSKLRARLAAADRLASIGTLAAGVAHEINNPLSYVIANIGYALGALADGTEVKTYDELREIIDALRQAQEGAERIRRTAGDLKVFSRGDEDRQSPVDVRRVLESSINIAYNEIRHRAHLVRDFAPVPPVDANDGRLGQVFLNLLVNAAQAIPEGSAEQNEVRVTTRSEGGRVIVEIADTGSGIHPDQMHRIFEPFFTTKPVGVGTGLGLSICHGIVHSLAGELTVESQRGKGTVFRVSLPCGVLAQEAPTSAPSSGIPSRGARILVVDDEPMLARVFQRTLGREHEVVAVTDAREAARRVAEGEHFDVVLCDLMMPNMSGMDLFAELERRAPELARRTIFLTGGAFTPRARAFLDEVPNLRFEKPVQPQRLRAVIRELVHEAERAAATH